MLDARAAKSNGGVFFHGEEGVGTQMGITQYIMRIDTGRCEHLSGEECDNDSLTIEKRQKRSLPALCERG
jgi:hypothetical protein